MWHPTGVKAEYTDTERNFSNKYYFLHSMSWISEACTDLYHFPLPVFKEEKKKVEVCELIWKVKVLNNSTFVKGQELILGTFLICCGKVAVPLEPGIY